MTQQAMEMFCRAGLFYLANIDFFDLLFLTKPMPAELSFSQSPEVWLVEVIRDAAEMVLQPWAVMFSIFQIR